MLKLTVFSVYLNGFYTHLNAITIENFPLNMVIKKHTHLYCLFWKWITRLCHDGMVANLQFKSCAQDNRMRVETGQKWKARVGKPAILGWLR